MDNVSVTLVRYVGENKLTGHYLGYPVVTVVTVEKTLTLVADNETQLANMVNIASIDGWRRQ